MSIEKELEELEKVRAETKKKAPPKTMKELNLLLAELGENWRLANATTDKKTGDITKIPDVPPRQVANILKANCTFILIGEDNPELSPLAVYDLDNGIYQKGTRFIYRLCMQVQYNLTEYQCKTIIHYLTVESEERERTTDKNLIVVKNGVYHRKKHKLLPFSSKYVFVNKIDTNYIPNAKEPDFKDWNFSEWIKELSDGNASKEKLLWQLFAVTINANYISEVAVFFYSEQGRTGKSTFQQLLINLVGKQNASSLKIKEFESDFKLASAYGHSLIVGDDNNPKDFNGTSENFKSVITGDTVLLNPKGREPFSTILTPFVVQSMNGLPRFKDITDGLQRRLRIILFNHSYKGEKNNRNIKEKYIHDKRLLEFILSKVIDMDFVEIEDTAESQEAIHELILENSAVLAFYDDLFQELESERLPVKFLFKLFQAWSDYENQPTQMKQNTFTKEIKGIAEKNGWLYSRKNLAPLSFFNQRDMARLESLDIHYRYSFSVDTTKTQPLIEKRQTDKMNKNRQ
ncbi:DNA primase family protein [Enterococcus sp. DIV0086]|uniref:DNA primase family protein n=1 Tax=Enterococcus sp. DIV0086 TaxID=2774655 RepID=UPI003D2E5E0D